VLWVVRRENYAEIPEAGLRGEALKNSENGNPLKTNPFQNTFKELDDDSNFAPNPRMSRHIGRLFNQELGEKVRSSLRSVSIC